MFRSAYLGLTLALLLCLPAGCTFTPKAGVSHELALQRAVQVRDVRYSLCFEIPEEADADIPATETVTLQLLQRRPIFLDFREDAARVLGITINGDNIPIRLQNEHLIIPRRYARKGPNEIRIRFVAGKQSLNRRGEFLYTLLVPDRARTLFPCFDQPDLKARYSLSLTVPGNWTAVSNTYIEEETPDAEGRKAIRFAETEPLSTYLFSFVAGRFERDFATRAGRTISMYYRETDPARLAQKPEVFRLVFDALDAMETYTGIPYPFAKYDFIVLPDFQYGGMEHTGATLYNDRRIFLGPEPTTDERLDRAQLIAHETAHMWFGDFVTMRWFNDVWTKEVFANWFAAQIVRPAFPSVNHALNDLKSYYAPAYAEDRTIGSNAIQRPLDNLSNAGLIYGNIIYDKAPVVMQMLADKMGAEPFRRGLRRYLKQYGYGNASWDDLIAALSPEADFDIDGWSHTWVKEPGMPCLTPDEYDTDVMAYGWLPLDEVQAERAYTQYPLLDETARLRSLINLYENVWRRRLDAGRFVDWAAEMLLHEENPLIFGSLLGYAADAARWSTTHSGADHLEAVLRQIARDDSRPHELRLQSFRTLYRLMRVPIAINELYAIWEQQKPYPGLVLGETDYTALSYQLMLRFPERAADIREKQRVRITHPDRLAAFDFVVQAASPDKADRDAFFRSLLQAENRRPESRVLTALDLLCHPLRGEEAVTRIRPALDALPEIQRTGDIFFPASWCKRILGPQTSAAAKAEVEAFLAENPQMHPLLKTKVLQAAGWLLQSRNAY